MSPPLSLHSSFGLSFSGLSLPLFPSSISISSFLSSSLCLLPLTFSLFLSLSFSLSVFACSLCPSLQVHFTASDVVRAFVHFLVTTHSRAIVSDNHLTVDQQLGLMNFHLLIGDSISPYCV